MSRLEEYKEEYEIRRATVLASLPQDEWNTTGLAARLFPMSHIRTLESTIGPNGQDLRPWYRLVVRTEAEFFQALAVLPKVVRGEVVLEDEKGIRMETELGKWFYYGGQFRPYLRIELSPDEDEFSPHLASPRVMPSEVVCKGRLLQFIQPVCPVFSSFLEAINVLNR